MLARHHIASLAGSVLLLAAGAAAQQIDGRACSGWRSDPDRAIEACTQALRLFNAYGSASHHDRAKNFAWVHFNLGAAYREKGELDKALAELTRSIEAEPMAAGYAMRAFVQAGRGDPVAARGDIREALRLEPDDAELRRGLERLESRLPGMTAPPPPGRLSGLLAACRSGSFETMLPACDAALAEPSIGPVQKAAALAGRGLVYAYRDRLDDAARDLAEATRLDPDKPAYHATYGDILRKQGRTVQAAAAYRTALALDTDFAPARAGLDMLGPVPAATGAPDLVRRAQVELLRLGYPVGAADGKIGRRTEAAVRAWQKKAGRPQDGRITAALVDELAADGR
jgi:tetratricopeptide (TPR) repeat protein